MAILNPHPAGHWRVRVRDVVELRRPGGATQTARVAGIDNRGPGLLFDPAVSKDDLRPGTEVWTVHPPA